MEKAWSHRNMLWSKTDFQGFARNFQGLVKNKLPPRVKAPTLCLQFLQQPRWIFSGDQRLKPHGDVWATWKVSDSADFQPHLKSVKATTRLGRNNFNFKSH